MNKKRDFRALRSLEEHYFRDHPEEIGLYIQEIFDAYAEDSHSDILIASLNAMAKANGIATIPQTMGNTSFDEVNTLVQALGYRIMPSLAKEPEYT